MNNKLKLPLTAVFSFLLGGVVFLPWGSSEKVESVSSIDSMSNFVIDKVSKQLQKSTKQTPAIVVKKVDYNFSTEEIKISNSAIHAQLRNSNENIKSSDIIEKVNLISQNIVVEYRFSKDELQESNLAIKSQLKNENAADKKIIKMTKNNFLIGEIKESNQAINKQLKSFAETKEVEVVKVVKEIQESEIVVILEGEIEKLEPNDNKYLLSADELQSSNLAIRKQLSRYIDNSDDFEISEKSESEQIVVNDIDNADYKNDDIESELSDLEISNLAILKQLRSYTNKLPELEENQISIVEIELESESTLPLDDVVDESKLLISNSAHENDFVKSSNKTIVKKKKSLVSISESDFFDENNQDEDEGDEDEFGSRRIVFKNDPRYFTDSFDIKPMIKENIALPNIENIEEMEIIEELEINSDGKIIASSIEN